MVKFSKNKACRFPELGIYDNIIDVPMPNHMKSENREFYDSKTTLANDSCILEDMEYLARSSVQAQVFRNTENVSRKAGVFLLRKINLKTFRKPLTFRNTSRNI